MVHNSIRHDQRRSGLCHLVGYVTQHAQSQNVPFIMAALGCHHAMGHKPSPQEGKRRLNGCPCISDHGAEELADSGRNRERQCPPECHADCGAEHVCTARSRADGPEQGEKAQRRAGDDWKQRLRG